MKSRFQCLLALPILVLLSSCSGRDPAGLEVARAPVDPIVFHDDLGSSYYQPFLNTHVTAVEVDSVFAFGGLAEDGARSLRFAIPPANSALGLYTGGVLTASSSRDFTDFNALSFYARTDVPGINLDSAGFGNDNSGESLFEAGRVRIPIGQDWKQVIIPIPAAGRLIAERGLFTFAEALEETPGQPGVPLHPNGYNIYIDELRFVKREDLSVALSFIGSALRRYFVGSSITLGPGTTRFTTDEGLIQMSHSARYFDFESSDPSVAKPVARGEIKIVGEGSANISGSLAGFAAGGNVVLNGYAPPRTAAAAPSLPASQVISMFSDAYEDVPIDTWLTDWSDAKTATYRVAGQPTRMYTDLNFVGVDFTSSYIDASEMNAFHVDVYAPEGTQFTVKLVSFSGDGTSAETEIAFRDDTSPAFVSGGWSSLEIPLSDFTLPEEFDWSRIGQLVFVGSFDVQLVLVDNIYWHE